MKIGISANIRSIWDERRYERLRECGFDCFDYNMADTRIAPYTLGDGEFDAYLREEKALADAAGITIWQVHGPWQWPITDGTPEGRTERMEKMSRSIRGAAILGAKYWVVHPIMPYGITDLDSGHAADTRRMNVEFMSELVKVAHECGVTICLENMPFPRFSIATPVDILDIVKEINDPNFMVCLDTGHANIFEKHSPASTLRRMGEYVKVLHVHDNRGKSDEHMFPMHGSIDWEDFRAALKECGFNGVLSLETAPKASMPAHIRDEMYKIHAMMARYLAE